MRRPPAKEIFSRAEYINGFWIDIKLTDEERRAIDEEYAIAEAKEIADAKGVADVSQPQGTKSEGDEA